jgi:uncharacterized membrane protein YphA (DoxX/SURF4 family)
VEGTLAGRLAGAVLGVILLVSGVSKRVDRGWPATAAAFGAPAWTIPALPWFEMVLGSVLVVGIARPLAATVATLALLAFTGLLVANLAAGRRPPCACFGSRSSAPIGVWTLVRNVGLLGLAAIAVLA